MKHININKAFLLLLLFLFIKLNSFAQFGVGKPEEIKSLKSRELIVIVETLRERVVKKLEKKKKTDKLQKYKEDIAEYNNIMKEVFQKHWKFSDKGILFMTLEEANKIKDKNKYGVVLCYSAMPSSFSTATLKMNGIMWSWDVKDDSEDRNFLKYYTKFSIDLLENLNNMGSPIFVNTLVDIFPTKTDIITAVKSSVFYMNYRLEGKTMDLGDIKETVKQNAPLLKEKTLLLRKDFLSEKLTEEIIKAVYPFKYEICSKERMDEIVINGDSNYAYALIKPNVISGRNGNFIIFIQEVYSADNGCFVGLSMPSMATIMLAGSAGFGSGKKFHTEKNLEDFCESIIEKKK